MKFAKIQNYPWNYLGGETDDEKRLHKFVNDFNIVGYEYFAECDCYKHYLERVLIGVPPIKTRTADKKIDHKYWHRLFDHGRFFQTKNGRVILVSMVYSNTVRAEKDFQLLKEEYELAGCIKMKALGQEYNFYNRKMTTMLLFYAGEDLT